MTTWIHQGVLFAHVVAFAIAFSAVLREDLALIRAKSIDLQRLAKTARTLSAALAALWLSGLALMSFDVGLDWGALAGRPKPMAKMLVVSALTANGLALHALVFPMLRGGSTRPRAGAAVPVVLGAISTTSWFYASFMGVSRVVAPALSLTDFLLFYGVLLAVAVVVALVFVRPRVALWMSRCDPQHV